MVLAKSSRETLQDTKHVENVLNKEKPISDPDVLCESIKDSVIERIVDASEVVDDAENKPKRKFDSRLDHVDKFGRVYNVEELERQIRD